MQYHWRLTTGFTGMRLLIIGMILFVSPHLFTAVPSWRLAAVKRLGEWPYKAVFALLSLLGLGLAGTGYARGSFGLIWEGPRYSHEFAMTLMPLATTLLVAAYLPSNVKRLTAHPMLWGVALWSLAHLLVRGHTGGLILFGGLGLYALVAMALAHRRGVRPARKQRPVWQDLMVIAVGLLLFGLLLILHPTLFGSHVVN